MSKVDLHWQVTHEDGTKETEHECNYQDLNRETIVMISLCEKNGSVLGSIACSKETPFFYRRRVRQRGNEVVSVLWIIGTRDEIVGIFDNGEIKYQDMFIEDDEWFYSINFREDEKWPRIT